MKFADILVTEQAAHAPQKKWNPVKMKDGTVTMWLEVFRVGNTNKYASIPDVSRSMTPEQMHAHLAQLKDELAQIPSSPTSQKEYDMIDNLRDEIASIESHLTEAALTEQRTPMAAMADAEMRFKVAMDSLADQFAKIARRQERDPTNWGIIGDALYIVTELETLATRG